MSYAASFAMDNIPDNFKDELKRRIDKLDYISVRESDAIKLLQDIGINRGVHVLDPVFLLDRSYWEKMAKPIVKGRYVLIYNFDNEKVIFDVAKKVAAVRNCQIIAANNIPLVGVDKNYRYASPKEFLGLIRNAEYVVTNSFHAIAFALIFNVEFLALERTEKLNSRMIDLLRLLGLEKRYLVDAEFDVIKMPSIDYQEIENKMDVLKRKSKTFIENALSNKVNN
jgi:polysaccharide pyruvyl transferase WcaK-like protein